MFSITYILFSALNPIFNYTHDIDDCQVRIISFDSFIVSIDVDFDFTLQYNGGNRIAEYIYILLSAQKFCLADLMKAEGVQRCV